MQNIDLLPGEDRLRIFVDSFGKICYVADAMGKTNFLELKDAMHTFFREIATIQRAVPEDSVEPMGPYYAAEFEKAIDAIKEHVQALKSDIRRQKWRYVHNSSAWNVVLPALAVLAALLWTIVWSY
jgi:hypothetical protein